MPRKEDPQAPLVGLQTLPQTSTSSLLFTGLQTSIFIDDLIQKTVTNWFDVNTTPLKRQIHSSVLLITLTTNKLILEGGNTR